MPIFPIIATSKEVLKASALKVAEALDENGLIALQRFDESAEPNREQHIVCFRYNNSEELSRELGLCISDTPSSNRVESSEDHEDRAIVFLFTGQGSQFSGMGAAIIEHCPTINRSFYQIAEHFEGHLDHPLPEVMFDSKFSESLNQTQYVQPALFALECAVARFWVGLGVRPKYLVGHSLGEIAAASIANVIDETDCAKLVAERSRLMQSLPAGGGMLAVQASEQDVLAYWSGFANVSIAAKNGPMNIVLSGPLNDLNRIETSLKNAGISAVPLKVSHAFHSVLVEPILETFGSFVSQIKYGPPHYQIVSNLYGRPLGQDEIINSRYWVEHLRGTVRYSDGIQSISKLGPAIYLEVGPQPTLTALAKTSIEPDQKNRWLFCMKRGIDDVVQFEKTACELICSGVRFDWRLFNSQFTKKVFNSNVRSELMRREDSEIIGMIRAQLET
jgi:acyl transferase domain-containing protein